MSSKIAPAAASAPDLATHPPSVIALFVAFAKISLAGFGGVLVFARRAIVDEHRWMTAEEFNETFALCHFLPGPNVVNLSLVFGSRFRGIIGGLAAFAGLLGPPMLLVTVLAALYSHFGQVEALRQALVGVSCAAIGLLGAAVFRMMLPLLKKRDVLGLLVMIAVFAAIGPARLPLPAVLLVAVPISLAVTYAKTSSKDVHKGRRQAGAHAMIGDDHGNPLFSLAWTFAVTSLFAVGGANAAIPEMHRIAVDVHHWLTDKQFNDAFAIAQLSPGPNVLIVTLIGYSVAGVIGALVATLAMCGPTAALAYVVSRWLTRSRQARWPAIVQAALVPLSIGLMAASALVLAQTSDRNAVAVLVTVAAAIVASVTRLNPLWLLLAGGCLGFAGVV